MKQSHSKQKRNGASQKKYEQSTISTDESRVNDSTIRLITSEQLTMEMAIGYLFKWRKNSKMAGLLLQRITKFQIKKIAHYIPTIIFIMSLDHNDQFFHFFQSLAQTSLPLYLIVRWSLTTYYPPNKKSSEIIRDKLDSSLSKKTNEKNQELDLDEENIKKRIKEKEFHCNYLAVLNDFYERLFKIPEKLKKNEKGKRNEKLRNYLNKITATFMKQQAGYLNGQVVPIQENSCVMVRILPEFSFTFSTKERVPFKLVFETISLEDALKCKSGIFPKSEKINYSQKKNHLILPTTYFGSIWDETEMRIRQESPYSEIPSYEIKSYMIKSGDDLRQEYLAMQLIKLIEDISRQENLKIWVKSYSVIPFNQDSGLIQFVHDTKTVSYLKEKSHEKSLYRIYQQIFGDNYEQATLNFIQSLAGYSLVQYLFQIKDRHNNNILIDTLGHMIHIDFSFIISSSPGNMGFERAPFKLTEDYIELMEGFQSDFFDHFKMQFFLGLKFIRKYKKQIMENVLMMTHCSGLKCFQNFDQQKMEKRFHQHATDQQLQLIVNKIIQDAYSSFTTSHYDTYQWYTNFIYS